MIKFPEMRAEMVERLQVLSDMEYQKKYWGSRLAHLDFDWIVHFFFDLPALADAPEENVGYILEKLHEAKCVKELCDGINCILDTYGRDKSDLFYINTPEWKHVIEMAENLLDYLMKNDPSIVLHEKAQIVFHKQVQDKMCM